MCLRFFLILIFSFFSSQAFAFKGGSSSGSSGWGGSIIGGATGAAVGSVADGLMRFGANETAKSAINAANVAQQEADAAKAAADACVASGNTPTVSYSNCMGQTGGYIYSAQDACNSKVSYVSSGTQNGVYGAYYGMNGTQTIHTCKAYKNGVLMSSSSSVIYCNSSSTAYKCDALQQAATAAQNRANGFRDTANLLKNLADAMSGRDPNNPSLNKPKTVDPTAPDYLKGNGNDNSPITIPEYGGADGGAEPVTSKDPKQKPNDCVVGDRRLECIDDYEPTKPCSPGDTRAICQDSTSGGSSSGSTSGSCPICCDSSDPAYGGTAQQVDKLRGEQAKDKARAEQSMSNMSKFFNNRRVGFDNGVIDGDYQSKHNFCDDKWCGYSYCDLPEHANDSMCVQYRDQDYLYKKSSDYGVISTVAPQCPTFTVNTGFLGTHAVTEHCQILDAIKTKIATAMTFLSLFIAFRIISSA